MTLLASTSSPPDSALLAAAKSGDRHALGELVSRHFGAVWAIGFARLGRRDAADDLAQEVTPKEQFQVDLKLNRTPAK